MPGHVWNDETPLLFDLSGLRINALFSQRSSLLSADSNKSKRSREMMDHCVSSQLL